MCTVRTLHSTFLPILEAVDADTFSSAKLQCIKESKGSVRLALLSILFASPGVSINHVSRGEFSPVDWSRYQTTTRRCNAFISAR